MPLAIVVGVVLAAVAIRMIGSVTSSLRVTDWWSAFVAAVAITAIAWILAGPLDAIEATMLGLGPGSAAAPEQLTVGLARAKYVDAGVLLALNSFSFFGVALFVPGIMIRAVRGVVLVGVVLSAIDLLLLPLFF